MTDNTALVSPWLAIAQRAMPVLVTLAILLLAYAWTRCRRFGPQLGEQMGARPQLLDHIRASGQFSWRVGARSVLLDAVRESVLRTIQHRRPGWLSGDDHYRDEQIANFCDLPQEQVTKAFAKGEPANPRVYTEAVASLEIIRNRL